MKIQTLFIALLLFSNSFGAAPPDALIMRIQQMQPVGKNKGTKLITEWPKNKSGLFQGLRKGVDSKILTKADHLKAISKIPKRLLENRKIGSTIELDGWFYTSIENDAYNEEQPIWNEVVASRKGTKYLYFSYTW